jgi:hypothetical protein
MSEPEPRNPKPSLHLVSSNAAPRASADPPLFGAHAAPPESRNWFPMLAGFGLVLAAVAVIVFLNRGKQEVAAVADPYSPKLVVEEARISQAANFIGSTVTYIDLTTRNTGDRTVVGGMVQATFRDSLGQPVQTETLPLRVLLPHPLGGAQEAADLSMAPLAPGQTRVLRLTLEHISSQWNRTQPELEFCSLRFK